MARRPDRPERPDDGEAGADLTTLGDSLREARERSGLTMDDLSIKTRIPPRYLRALEHDDFSVLPTRAFSTGYVKAYAAALGMDEQAAVERFRRESPDPSVPLQAPVGVRFEDVRRLSPRIAAAAGVVLAAVVGWNVFQRVSLARAPQPSDLASVPADWAKADGKPMVLSAAEPAPPDQTTPQLYITPGLELQLTGVDPETAPPPDAAGAPVRRAFNPRGAIYGSPANASRVVLQATKPMVLVVRLPSGQALFARQLAKGDAWRAPLAADAVIDTSEPAAFDVYLNGEFAGPLTAPQTPLAGLNARAEAQVRQAQAELEAQARTQAAAQARANPPVPAASTQAPAAAPTPAPTPPATATPR